MKTREDVRQEIENLKADYKTSVEKLSTSLTEKDEEITRLKHLLDEQALEVNKLSKYAKLEEAFKDLIPSVASASESVAVNTSAPKYVVNVEEDKIKMPDFKKGDLRTQVLHGIKKAKGHKYRGEIVNAMLDMGYKKAADTIDNILKELMDNGLVQQATNNSYSLTRGVEWHFPED